MMFHEARGKCATSQTYAGGIVKTMITGKIHIAGYYKDGLPSLIINVKKEDVPLISLPNNVRVDVTMDVYGVSYSAGIRMADKKSAVKICPDLLDETGREMRLSDLLLSLGYNRKETIKILFESDRLKILPKGSLTP